MKQRQGGGENEFGSSGRAGKMRSEAPSNNQKRKKGHTWYDYSATIAPHHGNVSHILMSCEAGKRVKACPMSMQNTLLL
jgi:hypothetical protein